MKVKEKILLIIDPQNDFITGSLAVPDAPEKMDNLREFIENHREDFDRVVITLDAHPKDHCSFIEQGGPWPEHCVEYTPGYLPQGALLRTLHSCIPTDRLIFVEKGLNPACEEYGAFGDAIKSAILLPDRTQFSSPTPEITIAGIMSEYCVVETLKNLVADKGWMEPEDIILWLPGISTMDDHKTLLEVAKEKGITNIVTEKR